VALFIVPMGDSAFRECSLLAREIRQSGAIVELVPAGVKLKRALETADKIGAIHSLIVGEDEIAAGAFTLKNMKSGEQERLSRQEIIDRFTCQTR
jgi:histidyl-tRNA synthetase